MDWLTRLIVTLLRYSEPMVPAEQRAWARALRTEAGQIPAGWERLAWLAGGVRFTVRQAALNRGVVYPLVFAAAAAGTAWSAWSGPPGPRRPGDSPAVPKSPARAAPSPRHRTDGPRLPYGRPLLAPAARRRASTLLACCAILVAVLGVAFAHHTTADHFDQAIDSPVITRLGSHPSLAAWLAAPGSQLPAVGLSALIVVACLLTRRFKGALLAAAAVPAAVGLNDGLCKPLVHRTYLGALSYPSGHTAAVFAVAATVAVLLYAPPQPVKARVLRIGIPAAACVLGCMVAVGVIGLRWHYFTDTVAGAAVGIGTVCALALLLDLPTWLGRPSVTRVGG